MFAKRDGAARRLLVGGGTACATLLATASLAWAQPVDAPPPEVAPEAAARAPEPEPPLAPAPAPPPATEAAPTTAAAPADVEAPLAGFHNGLFYLRSRDDVFRFYVQGRVHVDGAAAFGPGVGSLPPDQAIKPGFTLRRARLEIGGEFFQLWQWQLGVDFAPLSTDNPGATIASRSCVVDPKTAALTCSDRENPVEAPSVRPAPTDVFVNYGPSPYANLQVGQFYVPFTLENRISDNTTPFLERSLPVRAIGAPTTRDIGAMAWGESPDHLFYYAVALLDGDGPNRPNADGRFDVAAHAFVRPLANLSRADDGLRRATVGVSARYGSRDSKQVGYDMPALTTQSGFAFWRPTYKDSLGRTEHVIPSGDQVGLAADLYVPVSILDLTGEVVYANSNTREALDGYQLSPFTERLGSLHGWGYYAQVAAWVYGSRDVIGFASYGRPQHLDLKEPQKKALDGVQLLAKVEQLNLVYHGAQRGGVPDAATPDGDLKVISVAFGVNYWATRHLRVGLNYDFYSFPGSEPVAPSATNGPKQGPDERAVAPAQLVAKGADDGARDGGHVLHELQARVGVQF